MAAKKTPLQVVTQDHGGKEKLVDSIVEIVDRGEESKGDLRARLLAAANSKLLRLHKTATEIKQRFGSTDKLVDALLDLKKRAKDSDYREKLLSFTQVKLLGLYREAEKQAKKVA